MQSPISNFRVRANADFQSSANKHHRGGVTIIEVLIATALSLVMITAMVQIFAVVGEQVSIARSTLEMSGQLRAASHRFRKDLNGLTVSVRPWANPADGLGYFEIIEGPISDKDVDMNGIADVVQDNDANTIPDYLESTLDVSLGDIDDVIMFTARSDTEPFVGRWINPADSSVYTRESQIAEIIWWTQFNDRNTDGIWQSGEEVTLYRRVLLVKPGLPLPTGITLAAHYANSDISAHVDPVSGNLVANTLADLTKREYRFAHHLPDFTSPFPHSLNRAVLSGYVLSGSRLGEDVILSNVVGFDVRVFDTQVAVESDGTVALVPGDPGYVTPPPTPPATPTTIGYGAFVDLNYANVSTLSQFSGPPIGLSGLATLPTYCTWSLHYENDGINQDGDGLTDEGTNGVDDDNNNGVDDPGERETSPPYPFPLRGIKVSMRVIEIDTQQVRQTAVTSEFIPE